MRTSKGISDYKKGLRGRILETAMRNFCEHGIRAVKMDDVASELGISKRTLYELYDKKEELLYEGMKTYYAQREAELTEAIKNSKNVMEVILHLYRMKVEEFRRTCPAFYNDLVKYPKVLRFLRQKNQQSRSQGHKFLERGIVEGYFRDDLDYELAGRLFDAIGRYIMVNQLYKQYSIEAIFTNFVFVSLRGICTERGVKALDKIFIY